MSRLRVGVAFALLVFAGIALAQPPMTAADFERLHKELSSRKEPWQQIPWQLSLLDARTVAVKENKPIYALVRSGHPLGCV